MSRFIKHKKYVYLITFLIFFSILIIAAKTIGNFTKHYIPEPIYHVFEVILNNKTTFKRYSNDYNVKFLPQTESVSLNFSKIKINIKDNLSGYLTKKSTRTFFLEKYRDNLIIFSATGDISFIKTSILINSQQTHAGKYQKKINSNLKIEKILDTYLQDDEIYISFVSNLGSSCENLNLAKGKINLENIYFKIFYKTMECAREIQSGKIAIISGKIKKIYLSTAADVLTNADEQDPKPQDPKSIWGKVLEFNNENDLPLIFSSGHRNILGLMTDNERIKSTENGPAGGDEINLLIKNGNYGWDVASYGKKYSKSFDNFNYQDHEEMDYKEPIFSFLPSQGLSQIIKIPNSFNSRWKDNYLIGTLSSRHLLRIKFDQNYNKLIFVEKIFIGERIRDLVYLNNEEFIVLALEESGSIGVLSNIK